MKGDFTRDTFQPKKHYSSVRMQQGRLQLDADWNEQVDIQTYLWQTQIRDIVGDSGATSGGFKIGITSDGKDLTIAPGRIYVEGMLCELDSAVNYTQQPDYPAPLLPSDDGTYLVYLDVWQRHITAIEDPTLREVALGVPDTATRTQTVWQVKLLKVPEVKATSEAPAAPGTDGNLEFWNAFRNAKCPSHMTARVKPNTDGGGMGGSGYQRENHLYRVEVHAGDVDPTELDAPSGKTQDRKVNFKWSRDNGAIASAIKTIKGNTIVIESFGRDDAQFFAPGQWIEVTDDRRDLANQPGIFVRLTAGTAGNELKFDPNTLDGDQPLATFLLDPKTQKPKIRRWDHNTTEKAIIPLGSDWIALEAGIEVKFDDFKVDAKTLSYRTGDYWLLPVRANQSLQSIPWQNQPQAAPGIQHHYSLLADVTLDAETLSFRILRDRRTPFPSLATCLSNTAVLSTQMLGIGLKPGEVAQASLDVQANPQPGTGKLSSAGDINVNAVKDVNAVGDFTSGLAVGDLITVGDRTRTVTQIDKVNGSLQVNTAFGASFSGQSFTIQKPILLRLADAAGKSQVSVNAQGKLLAADVEVSGTFRVQASPQPGTGTLSSSGDINAKAVGNFASGLAVGDLITVGDLTRTVTQLDRITNTLQVNTPFGASLSGESFTIQKPILRLADAAGKSQVSVNAQGKLMASDVEVSGTFRTRLFTTDQLQVSGNTEIGGNLTVQQGLKLQGDTVIQSFSKDGGFTQSNDAALPTTQAVKTYVTTQLNDLNQILTGQINTVNRDLTTQINTVNQTLTTQIDTVNRDFTTQINTVNQTLTTQISGVDQTLTSRINTVNQTLTTQINGVNQALTGKANLQGSATQDFQTKNLNVLGTLRVQQGVAIQTFSSDGNFTLSSDAAVPTEKAVKTYVDTRINSVNQTLAQTVSQSTGGKADRNGSATEDFQTKNLKLFGDLQLQGPIAILDFSNDGKFSQSSDATLPTTKAVKTYVDDRFTTLNQSLLQKANREGAANQNFQAQNLRVQGTLQLQNSTPVVAFSNDGNFTLSSDDAIPTEKAVKTYVDSQVAAIAQSLNTLAQATPPLSNDGNFTLNSDDAIPTEKAVKTYVDIQVAAIAQSLNTLSQAKPTLNPTADTLKLGTSANTPTLPATLLAQGTAAIVPPDTTISSQNNSRIVDLQGTAVDLQVGDVITADGQARIVTQITPLTVNVPFVNALNNVAFTYQHPITRLQSNDGTTQWIVTAQNQSGDVSGDVIMGTTHPSTKLKVGADVDVMGTLKANNLANASSSVLKQNIEELSSQESRLLLRCLRPVKFQFKSDATSKTRAGFIAEEVPALLVSEDKTAINPLEIVAVLTKTVQEQQQAIASLTDIIQYNQTQIALLTEKVSHLEANAESPTSAKA